MVNRFKLKTILSSNTLEKKYKLNKTKTLVVNTYT